MNGQQQRKPMKKMLILWIVLICFLCGCGKRSEVVEEKNCNVVIEQGEGFSAKNDVQSVSRGSDVVFEIALEKGYKIVAADYKNYTLEPAKEGEPVHLTIHRVKYPVVVTLTCEKSDGVIIYDANGGELLGAGTSTRAEVPVFKKHLRVNTSIGTDLLKRDGYTLVGWNTKADGTGESTGLGSRVDFTDGMVLYAMWSPWTKECAFTYRVAGEYAIITGYHGTEKTVSVPESLDGKTVIEIEEDAFLDATCETVVLPKTIQRIENGAFQNALLQELYLYDNLSYVSDESFKGCKELQTLHINAIKPPVYSGSFYDTFQDKYDYLLSIRDQKKIVLFSGSSARFGFDSPRLKKEFPNYEVSNMGVFAYTNAYPQFLLIEELMQEGDILLLSPEFDARQRQFCTTHALDDKFFCMMESNYDTVASLDLRMVTKVFGAFYTYLTNRQTMETKSYELCASDFDEDGNPVEEPSYNVQGDYILYRSNADSVEPVFGLPVEYTVASFPKESYFGNANEVYERFLRKGIHVYFTYAPRNRYAISEESTPKEREKLHQYLQEKLIIPVISDLEESLYEGTWLYGTDNHLSTEGVEVRTERIIKDLHRQMEKDGLEERKEP